MQSKPSVDGPMLDVLAKDLAQIDALTPEQAKRLWLEVCALEKALAMRSMAASAPDHEAPAKKNALTAKDVAALLNVKPSFVHEMARQHKLKSYKLGKHRRFKPAAVQDYLAQHGA